MHKGDIRAVENPITAIFDLAEDVENQSPRIRVAIQYARIFIAFGLFLNALVIVLLAGVAAFALLMTLTVFLLMWLRRFIPDPAARTALLVLALVAGALDIIAFRQNLILGLVLVPFFFLGLVTMGVLRDVHGFFEWYALRHRIVKSVRDADPVAQIPDGRDPAQRVLTFLGSQNPEVAALLRTPGAAQTPAILRGRSGMTYEFDACVQRPPSGPRGFLGFGTSGSAVFVKSFSAPPTVSDLQAIQRAVEDVCALTGVPPTRVIAVWRASGDAALADDAYRFVTEQVVRVRVYGREFTCSLQSIEENADGTYDFIPYIPEIPTGGIVAAPAPPPARAA